MLETQGGRKPRERLWFWRWILSEHASNTLDTVSSRLPARRLDLPDAVRQGRLSPEVLDDIIDVP